MWTHRYRGWFLHGRFDSDEVQNPDTFEITRCSSYRSAQLAITRHLRSKS